MSGRSQGEFPVARNPPLEEACSEALGGEMNTCMRSEAVMARQGKLKRHDGSEVNAMALKTSFNASLPSLHDKPYSSLVLCIPQAILEQN